MGSPVSPQEDHLPQPQHSLPQLSSSEPRQADIPQSPQPPQPSQVPSGPAQLQQMLSSPQQQAAQAMLSHQQQQQMLSSPQQHTLAAAAASGGPVLSPSVAQRLAAALPPSQQHAMVRLFLLKISLSDGLYESVHMAKGFVEQAQNSYIFTPAALADRL